MKDNISLLLMGAMTVDLAASPTMTVSVCSPVHPRPLMAQTQVQIMITMVTILGLRWNHSKSSKIRRWKEARSC